LLALNESIRGKVSVSTFGFEDSVDLRFEIEEASIDLTARLGNDEFSLAPTSSGFAAETTRLTIDNKGEVELDDIDVQIDDCDASWVSIQQEDQLPFSLEADEKKELTLDIKAPALATAGQTQYCTLTVFYRHPLTEERVDLDEIEFSILPEEPPAP
jgi:uncharacterized membrane protein